jgi:hypothetical protein
VDGAINKSNGTRGSRANLTREWDGQQGRGDGGGWTEGHLVDGGYNLKQLVIRHVLEGEGALC